VQEKNIAVAVIKVVVLFVISCYGIPGGRTFTICAFLLYSPLLIESVGQLAGQLKDATLKFEQLPK